ncbi:hypothetical protein CRG98_003955 [Punica granatum]|uniref:Uncharacterized protein n=1 Tax=Punica granatum TaxID=22663 RepID=A0A2I0L4Q9_PUNGR|nr:hypothetical protein CRG98_003955 [Punica granatum]
MASPINRYSPDKPDCQSTRLHRFGECSCTLTQLWARFEAARVGVNEPSLDHSRAKRSLSRLFWGQHDPGGSKGLIGTGYRLSIVRVTCSQISHIRFTHFTVQECIPRTLDPGDSTALNLRVINSKWRLLLTCVRRTSPGRWTLSSRVA